MRRAESESMAEKDRRAAYVVRQTVRGSDADDLRGVGGVEWLQVSDLPAGEVQIEVARSSMNYKDAMACQGHPGVVGKLPHVPGIDCVGSVVVSQVDSFAPGQRVLVTGYDLGSGAWGGYSRRVRVPAEWVVPLPKELSADQAMIYGTAGFTAAQAVMALLRSGASPDDGPLLVTGASGGVGIFAVGILAKLGFEVVAMSGKQDMVGKLDAIGASRVIGRDDLVTGSRPLLKSEWAGGVDTVGGETLASLLRSTGYRGCVAACGLVGGADLPLTVYPFILRGVTLAGIDSAKCPREPRLEVWRQLAGPWRVELPPELVSTISLDGVAERAALLLAGEARGRTLVTPTTATDPPAGQ
ncbi:MAG: acryloyl-CoA reductase [Planctomycetota bacterium]